MGAGFLLLLLFHQPISGWGGGNICCENKTLVGEGYRDGLESSLMAGLEISKMHVNVCYLFL